MKAVIMAGGEGTRLRPLSLDRPKPMTPLFDRPVMEHIIALLRRSGITEIGVTLQYMPRAVTDYFGDGRAQGVHLTYLVEERPLGTAGSVKNGMSFLGDEDFLVISGDAVCDLDLRQLIAFHTQHHAVATLALHRHAVPPEYGLVLTDAQGRVERFLEKPAWGQVVTNVVNTGIYVLTRRAMDLVAPGQPCDFGRDLFPALLRRGEPIYGCVPAGYWCDMGDCTAYLNCVADALSGKVKLDLGAPQVAPGIWAASPVPDTVNILPPCYIGADVQIGPGSLLGPCTALGAGSRVEPCAVVQHSVLHGAQVGEKATLNRAILCAGARAERGSVLNAGTVLGEGACAGTDSILLEGVKVWPRQTVPDGVRLNTSLTVEHVSRPLRFGDGGVIRGVIGEELTPQVLVLLGNALGGEGQVGLGCCGGNGAQMLAQAALSGIAAAGGRALFHDAPTPAAGAWMGENCGLNTSLFIQQDGERGYLHLFDRHGLPLSRGRQRRLEGLLLRAECKRVPALRTGHWERAGGVAGAYAGDAARRSRISRAPLRPVTVSVAGESPEVLAQALEALGCTVLGTRREGIAHFQTAYGGFRLEAVDEQGRFIPPEQLLAVVTLIEYENGGGQVAVPAGAPAAIETLAGGYHARVLHLEQDGGEAETRYAALPWLRDGVFAACRICARMGVTGETLGALVGKTPRFCISRREVPLRSGRGEVMQALLSCLPGAQSTGEGLRLRQGEGWVRLTALSRRSALRVVGESASAETAAELCDFYVRQVRQLDKKRAEEK